ncbi:MAG: hypothetical protein QMD85_01095 [Candidatus Aenigmarchaeota archaeon]|nr:hypothetical protein [Candidatus Aenigmarchaeota archaeon]MDI6722134.1 hypothetical protein [Candidatus Aenigmarchaeota archaeon]
MGLGSYARFVVGLILSLEILRSWFFDRQVSLFAIILAIAFIVLAAAFFVRKFA